MNKIITLAALGLAGSTASIADNGPSFRAAPQAKQAPIVTNEVTNSSAKSTGRTALQNRGIKQAQAVYSQYVEAASKESARAPHRAQGIKQTGVERDTAGFKFPKFADIQFPKWPSRPSI